jgi:putative ABC transport system permease protein
LSYTDKIDESNKIKEGRQLSGIVNEVSVDAEFATRAGIKLNSNIKFSIQGIELESKVTSIRETERNSGLPFFYFLFNTKDLITYPATYFGYGYFEELEIDNLSKALVSDYPNVSTINTKEAGEILLAITNTLSILVLVIAIPPVILSIFLVTTLIILSFSSKRKLTAQFMALGSSRSFINKLFYIESSFFTIISSVFAYVTALVTTVIIAKYYLEINLYAVYSNELVITLCAIIFLILLITFLLSVLDKRSLKDLLSYEEN